MALKIDQLTSFDPPFQQNRAKTVLTPAQVGAHGSDLYVQWYDVQHLDVQQFTFKTF